jgi:hypothetical protein
MTYEKSADYLEGYKAGEQYHNSPCYASYARDITGEQAIKLFKPPITESPMMVASPLPKDRRDWIEGFNDWQKENSK